MRSPSPNAALPVVLLEQHGPTPKGTALTHQNAVLPQMIL